MTLSSKLTLFREYKNWQPENVAMELGLSKDSYIDLEKGRVKINGHVAQKLSDLYKVPTEFFLIDDTPHYLQAEVLYSNCTMISGTSGTSGYINHQNNDRGIEEILYLRKEEVRKLEQQVMYLREQNSRFLDLVAEKMRKE